MHIQGWRSSLADLTNSVTGCNSPVGQSADSGIALG